MGSYSVYPKEINFFNIDGKYDFNYQKITVGLTASFGRADSLFGKPVYYTASVSGTSDDVTFIKKMSYLAGAVFTIKQTSDTRLQGYRY